MAQDKDFATITLRASSKLVTVPRDMFETGDAIAIRQYAYESGQATKEEAGISTEYQPDTNPLLAMGAQASRTVRDFGSNLKQGFSELMGDEDSANQEKQFQADQSRLFAPLEEKNPVSSFGGQALPFFAVPGGKVAQMGFGALEGALSGDTPGQRAIGAGVGMLAGLGGQKAGDWLGARVQNFAQRKLGNVNANARKELLDAGIPMSLSQRTDGPVSKPLANFFERGRFVLTGKQPKGAAQQKEITGLITDALGIDGNKLTREVLGKAVNQNRAVFRSAADRVGGNIKADTELFKAASKAMREFGEVGTDSPQVQKIFDRYVDLITDPDGISPEKYLKLRSDLSEATTKSDLETGALVTAIDGLVDQIARLVPDLADDLRVARDRFRLLLAVRRGAALSPEGDVNINTLTRNLERVFTDFDAAKPLPRSLRDAGESIAALNQIAKPLRSSATAENLGAMALPGIGAASDPSSLLRFLMGASAPFAGGGAGGLLGGGTGRVAAASLLDMAQPGKPHPEGQF